MQKIDKLSTAPLTNPDICHWRDEGDKEVCKTIRKGLTLVFFGGSYKKKKREKNAKCTFVLVAHQKKKKKKQKEVVPSMSQVGKHQFSLNLVFSKYKLCTYFMYNLECML